jgi:hypothetical protein
MLQEAVGGGAFTWNRIQRLYDADPAAHWQRCESEGLECAYDVFAQLFTQEANNADFAVIVRAIDWGRVRWELEEFSGIAPRHVRVDRGYPVRQLARGSGSTGCRGGSNTLGVDGSANRREVADEAHRSAQDTPQL